MGQKEQYVNEIKAIRQMMEQSSRFLSLSGLSGILIGIHALVGTYIANKIIEFEVSSGNPFLNNYTTVSLLIYLAVIVLVLSFVTIIYLTYRKTKRDGHKIWSKGTRLLMINLAVPLVSGGILTSIFIAREFYVIVAPLLLVFYGLALVNASKFTRQEIYYMGLCQIVIGIIAAVLPGYALFLWAFGFGVIHILYGTIMHFRYEHHSKTKKL
jgi:general stress protein CsbA